MSNEKVDANTVLAIYKQRVADLTHQNVILEARLMELQKGAADDKRKSN
ncbi:hypothetical protein SAMN05192559_104106 [Halobacillus karajensis]|nr:hypothetical protein [Halobacillus karajensis]SEH78577.1 hypothetical protein SAMN05192559_104106 [Halobacillus karajensis]